MDSKHRARRPRAGRRRAADTGLAKAAGDAAALPRHVGIIMDGNRRWAAARGRPRLLGHVAGADAVRAVVTAARELGVPYLTLYAFSSENWARPAEEVSALMDLLCDYLRGELEALRREGIALTAIGDRSRLPAGARALLEEVEEATSGGRGMRLTLALSYGGRDEIARAARALAREVAAGRLDPEAIDPERIAAALDTRGAPDPDLVIRTGGEHRLSNFMLWQAAYAELYVTSEAWPDFDRGALERALAWYAERTRRFGR